MTRWLRLEPGPRENGIAAAAAVAVAASVGLVVFYLGRILVSREALPDRSGARHEPGEAREGVPRLGAGRR